MNNFEDYFDSMKSIPSIRSKSQPDQRTSFLSMRYIYILGYFTGNLPFQGLVTSKSCIDLKFKKLSIPFFLSWVILFAKIFFFGELTIAQFPAGMQNNTGRSPPPLSMIFDPPSITDIIASQAHYVIHGIIGIFSSVLFILSAKNFLDLIHQLEAFEKSYISKRDTPVMNIWVVGSTFFSLYASGFFCVAIYNRLNSPHPGPVYFLNYIPLGSGWVIMILYTLGIVLIEYGIILLNIQILYLSTVLSSMLTDIIQNVEGLAERNLTVRQHGSNLKSENLKALFPQSNLGKLQAWLESDDTRFQPLAGSWIKLGERYIKLERIFKAYEKFTGPLLILMFIALIASAVFTIYMGTTNVPFTTGFLNRINQCVTCGMACFRLYAITNVGETFQQQYEQLVKTTLKVGQMRHNLQETEQDEFDQFRSLVSNIQIKLSAAGFFNVQRGNITSIISVIITYIIVLIQFRQSEEQQEDSE